ncbi:hypothetical protein [Thalassoporum mexicanum]|nr:hypothetical protein [Pseudanabaena sp. PCC 7367]
MAIPIARSGVCLIMATKSIGGGDSRSKGDRKYVNIVNIANGNQT